MKNIFRLIIAVLLLVNYNLEGQMKINGVTYLGNEWIDINTTYYKIKVAEDGVYKINKSLLVKEGFWKTTMDPKKIAIFNYGKQIPLYFNSENFTDNDYILFYGQKNKIELDSFLYKSKADILNENISIISDSSIYYIAYLPESTSTLRYKNINPDYQNNNISESSFYLHNEERNFLNIRYKPTIPGSKDFQYSNLVSSEGFVKSFGSSIYDTIKTFDLYKQYQDLVKIGFRISNNQISNNIKTFNLNDKVIGTASSNRNEINKPNFFISVNDLKEENIIKINGTLDNHNFGLAHIDLTYPRIFDFKNLIYSFWETNSDKFAKLNNYKYDFIFDIKNNEVIKCQKNPNSTFTNLLLKGNKDRKIIFDNEIIDVLKISQFKPINLKEKLDKQYLIITSKDIYKSSKGIDEVNNYLNYRSSPEGGNYKCQLLYTEDIYDNFSYGVENHLMGFKNLNQFLIKNWPKLEYILLLGKGREYFNVRTNFQLNSSQNDSYFIPSFGAPPSDNMLFSEGTTLKTNFSIGRIAASNMEDIGNYLNKVIEHEQIYKNENNAWTKNLMHLGGGEAGVERNEISNLLKQMERIIEKPSFGGKVFTYYKDNTAQVQIANLPKIKENINSGLSIINFFGHAAVGTFDFTLDDPSNYENKGKYPFMFSLGCYSGNICTNGRGISEKFNLTKDRGSIGFIAASGTALLPTQGFFGLDFYTKLSNEFYNKSIGSLMKKIINEKHEIFFATNYQENQYSEITLYQQLILHADPAIKLLGFEKPDYKIASETIKTNPELITGEKDSFKLNFTIQNIKRAIDKNINVLITHLGPKDNVISSNVRRIKAPFYEENLQVSLNIEGFDIIGLNKISITVDTDNEVDEDNEQNNSIDLNGSKFFTFYILSNNIKISYPCEFSIVNKKEKLILKANNVNAFSPTENEYSFQIDTTKYFNSSLLEKGTITTNLSSFEYKPSFNPIQNTTYYWRVGKKNLNNDTIEWVESSFTYIENAEEGWRQQHQYQFEKNEFEYMKPIANNKFDFIKVEQAVNVRSQMYIDKQNIPYTLVNGAKYGNITPFSGNADVINLIVWTPNGFWPNVTKNDYGSLSWSNAGFSFGVSTESGRKGMRQALDNAPDSSYIFVYCYFQNQNSDYNYKKWNDDLNTLGYTLYNTMSTYGAEKFEKFKVNGPVPYIFIFRKGVGTIHEDLGINIFDQINHTAKVPFKGFFGEMNAEVGPASKWNNFSWDYKFKSEGSTDTFIRNYINIYKIDQANNETSYKYRMKPPIDLSGLDAKTYPKIRLEYDVVDYDYFEPAQINHWTVNYTGFPDLFLSINNNEIVDTVNQGEIIKMNAKVGVENVDYLDSVNLKIALVNSSTKVEKIIKLTTLKRGELRDISTTFETKNLKRDYQLVVSVNYDDLIVEKTIFNNTGVKPIYVKPDLVNPLLDVTFDGVKILDGDIVSPNTVIKIEVKDENKFLLMDKKEDLKFTITNNTTGESLILKEDQILVKLPTSTSDNKIAVTLSPNLEDGDYSLRANGTDYSQNASGKLDYNVNFKVVNKKEISNFINYPNPFSNSTKFIFDITGGLPENLRITIMTISGKIVREITSEQLGQFHVGRNISNYVWDGTDDFGNKLANGVYLYKISTSNSDFKMNNKFQTNGFGKLMIIR